ncbi:hypothetical protein V2J09_003483 [Rumex salicifolius]
MVISMNPVVCFTRMVSGSCFSHSMPRKLQVSSPMTALNLKQSKSPKHAQLRLFVAESDNITTSIDTGSSAKPEKSVPPSDAENNRSPPTSPSTPSGPTLDAMETSSSSPNVPTKRASLTAREKLRAARVLSRYNETKGTSRKAAMGSKLLDALRESDKGKKGLPEAPTNLFDDSKRGMPKSGLTFDFPGGFDLFVIIFSFVFISTAMFATTYFVWKVGAIHFND